MGIFENEFHDDQSDFDDRMGEEGDFFQEQIEEYEPLKEEDLYYRHIEEY